MSRKSYGQFCALARALDQVGDRWTLLIVRELLLGRKRYGALQAALPGIATNLLAGRLRELQDSGIVTMAEGAYALTERGLDLEPVVFALIRWGAPLMFDGPGRDTSDPSWARLALRALLEDDVPRSARAEVQVDVAGAEPFTVRTGRSGRQVVDGPADRPDAVVRTSLEAVVAAVGAGVPVDARSVRGSRSLAVAALCPQPR